MLIWGYKVEISTNESTSETENEYMFAFDQFPKAHYKKLRSD